MNKTKEASVKFLSFYGFFGVLCRGCKNFSIFFPQDLTSKHLKYVVVVKI